MSVILKPGGRIPRRVAVHININPAARRQRTFCHRSLVGAPKQPHSPKSSTVAILNPIPALMAYYRPQTGPRQAALVPASSALLFVDVQVALGG